MKIIQATKKMSVADINNYFNGYLNTRIFVTLIWLAFIFMAYQLLMSDSPEVKLVLMKKIEDNAYDISFLDILSFGITVFMFIMIKTLSSMFYLFDNGYINEIREETFDNPEIYDGINRLYTGFQKMKSEGFSFRMLATTLVFLNVAVMLETIEFILKIVIPVLGWETSYGVLALFSAEVALRNIFVIVSTTMFVIMTIKMR